MTVLITGAFGFVGSNLSAFLASRGFELWALDVAEGQTGTGAAYKRRFDWKALDAIPWLQVDAIIHLAGKAHDTRNTNDAQAYVDVNVGLTRRVLDAWQAGLAANSAPRDESTASRRRIFILFSSVKAVADRVNGVLTEDVEPNPKTPYGQSKLGAERVVERLDPNRFDAYRLRPCMIHGPGNKGNLNLLFQVAARGWPWPLGAYDNRRSFASIGNVSAVVEGLLRQEVQPGAYQVADDDALATNELIRLMAGVRERKARLLNISPRLIACLAKVGDGLHLPLNSERLSKLTESYVVSNAKIKHALGWERMPVEAKEGLRMTLEALGKF